MSSINSSKVILLCSPNLGVLENWLPVFDQIKELNSNIEITCLIGKPGAAKLIDSDSDLIKIAEGYIDEVVFKSFSNKWIKSASFNAAKKANTIPKKYNWLIKIEGQVRKYRLQKILITLSKLSYFFINKHYLKLGVDFIDIDEYLIHSKFLLLDMVDMDKGFNSYNKFLNTVFSNMSCFSMHHSTNIGLELIAKKYKVEPYALKNPNTLFYLYSKKDLSFYENFYGEEITQKAIGVPRHNEKWIQKVILNQDKLDEKYTTKPFLLLISRPSSDFLPIDRKEKALRDIKKFAISENGFNVVIKYHPKEQDFSLYEEVFGKEQYNKSWFYSKRHPYILAEKCKICVTFYSSLVCDFIFLNTPVIEYLNLKGIQFHDNENSYKDELNNPVFDYRNFGLTLGANNFEDLSRHASQILADKNLVLNQLIKNYRDVYYWSENSAKEVARDILDKMNDENSNN